MEETIMIRQFDYLKDLEPVMKIWIETTIETHHFIDKSYWEENYNMVKEMLQESTLYVFEENEEIKGFVGLIDTMIGGLFIKRESQSKGIGKCLLEYIKKEYQELTIQVYQKNKRGIRFYKRENFVLVREQVDENTKEGELVMKWKKNS